MSSKSVEGIRSLEGISLVFRGFKLVWDANPGLTILSIFISLVMALEPLAVLWVTKSIVDMLTRVGAGGGGIGGWFKMVSLEIPGLATLLGLQFAVWFGGRAVNSCEQIIHQQAQADFEFKTTARILKKAGSLDLAFFEHSANQDQMEKALRGSLMSAWNLVWTLFYGVRTLITTTGYLAILFTMNWFAPLIVISATAPQMFASAGFARERWRMWRDNTTESRLRYFFPWAATASDYAKETKFFGLSDYFLERFSHYTKLAHEKERKLIWKTELKELFLGTISSIGLIVIYLQICLLAFSRLISAGDAVLFMGATESCQRNLCYLFTQGGQVYENILYLSELFEFLDQKPEDVVGGLVRYDTAYSAPVRVSKGIEFRNVSFQYPHTERPVLQNLNFFLSGTESVAVVGKNGAGKSTLVRLLLRLYDPTEGSILLDGRDIREYDLNGYRALCSSVFQDFGQWPLTFRENVGFGAVERMNDTAQIEWAARQAGALGLVDRMPKRLENYLGKNYDDNGDELSGGEWQKVALARGLMRDSRIIVLDEPTASLDAFAEFEMFKSFKEITSDRLAVLISHRFSTVRIADKIIVLDEGRLVEEGTHEELMAKDALYASMFAAQADRYK